MTGKLLQRPVFWRVRAEATVAECEELGPEGPLCRKDSWVPKVIAIAIPCHGYTGAPFSGAIEARKEQTLTGTVNTASTTGQSINSSGARRVGMIVRHEEEV